MSRIVSFPYPIDSPGASAPDFDMGNEDDWAGADRIEFDEIESELQGGLDPSKWGVPRAFFVVQSPIESSSEPDTAC